MSSNRPLTIGYSPCPNDTFIFYGLVHGQVPCSAFRLAPPVLDDVETLNRWAMEGRLDITKLSFHALGHLLDRYVLLRSGAALGRGCGPLLITGKLPKGPALKDWKIAIPGEFTTAAMLLQLYAPESSQFEVMRFEQIIPAVIAGKVDAGVIIHESRFTYQEHGLECVQDLGAWWEETTGLPIPLGCIAARKSLSPGVITELDEAIRASLRYAMENPSECSAYIQKHAQELADEVVQSHIGLYVNPFSLELGDEGVAAVEALLHRGVEAGLFAHPEKGEWKLFR